tara:strand:+ start:900 stop:1094 length:195 start_codon:yes stop_codon:yes gene_type:complete
MALIFQFVLCKLNDCFHTSQALLGLKDSEGFPHPLSIRLKIGSLLISDPKYVNSNKFKEIINLN